MNKPIENEILSLLKRCESGDKQASDRLFEILHPELKRIASRGLYRQAGNITAQTTEIVNELYIKFAKSSTFPAKSRLYFFSCAAIAIEQIIIDYVRKKNRLIRGGNQQQVELNESMSPTDDISNIELLNLGQLLSQLKEVDQQAATILSLKLFAGMQMAEVAAYLNISERTAARKWAFAKSYMQHHMQALE